jgi:hypothetical protein
MSNIKPTVSVTVTDPKLFERIAEVKADTQAIVDALKKDESTQAQPARYFPRGYFG